MECGPLSRANSSQKQGDPMCYRRKSSCSPCMEWRVTTGNTHCKERGHWQQERTFPEQNPSKNYSEEAAEQPSPHPEQSAAICKHGILTTTFGDGSRHLHQIVSKITAIRHLNNLPDPTMSVAAGVAAARCCALLFYGTPSFTINQLPTVNNSIKKKKMNRYTQFASEGDLYVQVCILTVFLRFLLWSQSSRGLPLTPQTFPDYSAH